MPGRDDGRTRRRIRRSSRLSPDASSHPRRAPRRAPRPACRRCAAFRGSPRRSALFVSLTLRAPSLSGRPGYARRMLPQVPAVLRTEPIASGNLPGSRRGCYCRRHDTGSFGHRAGNADADRARRAGAVVDRAAADRDEIVRAQRRDRQPPAQPATGCMKRGCGSRTRSPQRRRRRLEHLVSAADRADFARDGFVVRRDFLPQPEFAELRRSGRGRIAARCARSPRATRSCARSRSIRAP